jgi:AraC-like DNA-binding protein
MAILIRTSELPAAQRLEAWRSVVCDTLGPLDMRADPDTPLHGEIEAGQLGSVGVGRVLTSTPHSVHRTRGLIRRDSPELYRVVLAVAGNLTIAQDDRSSRLAPGEFAIYDFTRPYDLAYETGVQLAVFSLPHALVSVPADPVRRLTATAIAPDDGSAALAAPLLRRVAFDLSTYRPESAARLSTVITDLVTAAVAERVERTGAMPEASRDRMLLIRVHTFIEQHLGETGLDPGGVAAAHHVSVRQLHRLFASQNTTVAAWIRQRRLEHCRRDLTDPTLHDVPVSAVAAKWGLVESAHFSRVFRAAYGLPPTEYRRTSLMSRA